MMRSKLNYAPLLCLVLGMGGMAMGMTVLRSASQGADTEVLKQQLQDHITENNFRLSQIETHNFSLANKLEENSNSIAAIGATQTMLVDQQNKIIFALWGMVFGVLSLFAERIASRIFDKRKALEP